MRRHSLRNSDKKKLKHITWLVVGVLLVGVLLPRLVSLAGMVLLFPIQATQEWFNETSMTVPALWRDKMSLQQQVVELQSQLSQQTSASISEQRLREENIQLRTLLSATTSKRVAATVITRPDQLPYDLLQIDQGSQAGIQVGAPVYANQEEVLGVVSEVYPRSALVTLFTTPGFSSMAYLGEVNMLVKVEGMGGGVARVLVPQGIPLRINSLVHVPSTQPGVLGRIVSVQNESTQPQQFGYIVTDTPLQYLRYVSVGEVTDITTDHSSVQQYLAAIHDSLRLPDTITASTTELGIATSSATTTDNEPADI